MVEMSTRTSEADEDESRPGSYAWLGKLREEAPVRRIQDANGLESWLVTGYAEAAAVLGDKRFSKERRHAEEPHRRAAMLYSDAGPAPLIGPNMLDMDPPDHTRLRGLVSKAFTPRRIAALRPRIQEIADTLLDTLAPAKTTDLIGAFAFPLPVTVICELLGVPPADRDQFRAWTSAMLHVSLDKNGVGGRNSAARSLKEYLAELVQRKGNEVRRDMPSDDQPDLVSALIVTRDETHQLPEEELLGMLALLLVAGHETTVNLIGNGMLALFKFPDQQELLTRSPELLPNAIEEFLRYDGPVMGTRRIALEDVDVGGTTIPAGGIASVSLGSADRDPRMFVEPDRLDLHRANKGHLAFGHGIHYCLGAPLARMDGEIAIGSLLRRFPGIRLGCPPERLSWAYSASEVFHSLVALPVRLNPSLGWSITSLSVSSGLVGPRGL
jgi:cytochrome P450